MEILQAEQIELHLECEHLKMVVRWPCDQFVILEQQEKKRESFVKNCTFSATCICAMFRLIAQNKAKTPEVFVFVGHLSLDVAEDFVISFLLRASVSPQTEWLFVG